MNEVWLPIPGFDGYEVSDHGRVRTFRNGKWGFRAEPKLMSGNVWAGEKYRRFILRSTDSSGAPVRKSMRAHALVLMAFVHPRPEGMVTRHLNGDPSDNRLSNLAYGTYSENGLDAVKHGDNPVANRTECRRGHTYAPESVAWDAKRRRRLCLTCRAINNHNSSTRRAKRRRLAKEQAS